MRKHTVTSLTLELERLLGKYYPVVLVEGEVSQLSTPSSGHCYLQLRDRQSTLSAVVWRSTWRNLRYRPKPGDRVLCRGRLGLYGAQGRYQLYVNVIRPAGEGDLARKIEERKARLEADGLLDPRRKRPLPPNPRVVGVATSLSGAALHDFLEVSRQRYPAARVVVADCKVQGDEAPASVIRALQLLIEHGRSDVLVVTRGGGSKLDLLPFMDEQLARFIAICPIPTVSAVGHEIDTTIADLVADAAAPTPSAAAMLVLPDGPALAQRVDEAQLALARACGRAIRRRRERVDALRAQLRHPGQRLAMLAARRTDLDRRLRAAMTRATRERALRLAATRSRLDALSPYNVLERGYAIVSGPDGIVSGADQVHDGLALDVRVHRGHFAAVVTGDPDVG